MTTDKILRELIVLLGRAAHGRIFISASSIRHWPEGFFRELAAAKLLRKAKPASSISCPGCHHGCSVKVLSETDGDTGIRRDLAVCDRRDDIGFVPLDNADLEQWQFSLSQLVEFLKTELPLIPTAKPASRGLIPLGRIEAEHAPRLVAISTDQSLDLAIGHERLPIIELIFFRDGCLKIDVDEVQRLADRDETLSHVSYVPSATKRERGKAKTADRHQYWKEEYRRMKRADPNWSDEAISETIVQKDPFPGKRKAETVRRYMK